MAFSEAIDGSACVDLQICLPQANKYCLTTNDLTILIKATESSLKTLNKHKLLHDNALI